MAAGSFSEANAEANAAAYASAFADAFAYAYAEACAGEFPEYLDFCNSDLNTYYWYADAYAQADLIEDWPMTFLVDYATNLDASSALVTNPAGSLTPGTFSTSDEDDAWMIAFQIGDAKKIVRFRTHYAYLEANSFPAQFVDSDLFDGRTNRKGWVWDLTKTVMKNTDASVTAFLSDTIEESGGYDNSQVGGERFHETRQGAGEWTAVPVRRRRILQPRLDAGPAIDL